MLACLFVLLNVLLAVSRGANSVVDQLTGKLGMYFYIKDDPNDTERIYTRVMSLKDDLLKQGIQAEFSSKDDALKFLEQRLPEVLSNLKQYNIDNPLPATLYVSVRTEEQYQQLKQTVLQYRSIITNVEDVDKAKTLKTQEQRIVSTIGIANTVVIGSYVLIAMLLVIMVSVIIGMVRADVYKYRHLIEVKKLLWWSYQQMILPFVSYGLCMATLWRGISVGLMIIISIGIAQPITQIFSVDIISIAISYILTIGGIALAQLVILRILMGVIWYQTVYHHIRKY